MIAETLAGISLFKAAVDGIKSAIGTANDVSDIAGYIDNLFEGEEQVQRLRSKKSGVGGVADQFGVKSVATEVINAKLAKEQMQEIASMIDMRFGHGTWKSITEERAKRIREAKEAAAAVRKEKARKQKELEDNIKTALGVFVLIAVIVGLFFFLIASVAAALNV
jgi:hypothetical protein|tara:strand:- start:934 stop:1428 length:495 start_codon:yes stop_codon:yes gene_type:complete